MVQKGLIHIYSGKAKEKLPLHSVSVSGRRDGESDQLSSSL